MLTLESRIQNAFFHPQNLEPNILNHLSDVPEDASKSLLEPFSGVAERPEKTSFEGSDNYLIFLMLMLIINVFLHGSDIVRALFVKKEKSMFVDRIKQTLISLLIGSLIFCLYQVIWICLGSTAIHEVNMNNTSNLTMKIANPARVLEEEAPSSSLSSLQLQEYKKPSLSIGNVLGQVDIYAISIQVSKDGKTAFVITNFPSALKIIDVSEPESPAILGSLILPPGGSSNFVSKALLVSPDETTLYLKQL